MSSAPASSLRAARLAEACFVRRVLTPAECAAMVDLERALERVEAAAGGLELEQLGDELEQQRARRLARARGEGAA